MSPGLNDKPNGSDLYRVGRLFVGHRIYAALQTSLSLVEGFLEAAILTLFARLALLSVEQGATSVYVPGFGPQASSFALGALLALIMMKFIVGFAAIWSANRLQFRLIRSFRLEAIKVYAEASWTDQSRLDEGALQQLVVTLPNGLGGQLSGLLSNFGQFCIMLAMLTYAFLTDARLTLLLILVIGLSTFAFKPLREKIRHRSAKALKQQQLLSHSTSELSGLKFEVQAFGIAGRVVEPLFRTVDRESAFQESASRLRGTVVPTFTSILYLAVTLGLMILSGSNPESFERTGPILLVVLRSLSYGVALQQAATGISSIVPTLDVVEGSLKELQLTPIKWGNQPFEGYRTLEFRDVVYKYPSSKSPALKRVSVAFQVGAKIGVVGPSGGGKSTLAKLALGIIEPTSGQVLINGRSIQNFSRMDVARRVAVVPQSATMMRGSIAFNLALFREGISENHMWDALRIADLEQEIQRLPDGLETLIGTGHRQLSGGQQQRLAIARAFVGKPELVVMDEPTSSVDAGSEAVISRAIDNLPSGVTVLIVSHRMRILEGCDQLIVIEDGTISASGAPEEILRESAYARSLDLK